MPNIKPIKSGGRQERLAAELRANLKKRKAQTRARQQAAPAGEIADAPQPDLRAQDPSAKA